MTLTHKYHGIDIDALLGRGIGALVKGPLPPVHNFRESRGREHLISAHRGGGGGRGASRLST